MSVEHAPVGIPGTTVVANLVQDGARWTFALYDETETLGVPLAEGELDLGGDPGVLDVTPDQVARIAFLLELEY